MVFEVSGRWAVAFRYIFYKCLSSPVLTCLLWEWCFILFILIVVNLDFWGFTGCTMFEVLCQFLA